MPLSTLLASPTIARAVSQFTPRKLPKPTSTAYQMRDAIAAGTSAWRASSPAMPAKGGTAARSPGESGS